MTLVFFQKIQICAPFVCPLNYETLLFFVGVGGG